MRRVITLLTLAVVLLGTTPLSAQNSALDTQKRIVESIKRQISEGEKLIESLRKSRSTAQSQVQSLASQVAQRNRLLGEQQSQINLIKIEIDSINSRQELLAAELEQNRELYARMVREAYRNYNHNNFISYLFAADDFNDVARRIVNLRRAAQLREQRIAVIDSISSGLDSTRRCLVERKASLDSVALDVSRQREHLERDVASARASINAMSSKEKSALREKSLQEQKLTTALEELRRLSKGNQEGASFNTKTSQLNLPVIGGKVKRYMDNMAEVVGAAGAQVISIYEGKVVDIKQNRITGRYDVYIAHGEYISSYSGLRSVSVAKSSTVKKNQTIGEVGAAVDIITLDSEYKIVFGIYPPSPTQKMKASDCFKK